MQIDTAGTYTLKYTAEDECGNVTEVTREVVAEAPPKTVLRVKNGNYGTLIINEQSRDTVANRELYGDILYEYTPYNPDGSTATERYEFTGTSLGATPRLWESDTGYIRRITIGEPIRPTNIAYWFRLTAHCESMDLSNLDFANIASMKDLFYHCDKLQSVEFGNIDTSNVVDMTSMFSYCGELVSPGLNLFDTSKVTSMSSMFNECQALSYLDLSSFDTSRVEYMNSVFRGCTALKTIVASGLFETSQVIRSIGMFSDCSSLVGGAGTAFDANNTDKTYARIDNPPTAPGYFTATA